ncbi:MAG TPA: hypothetical protein VH114_04960 [Candidatus Acidoferrum sp.]|jgi:hypothetical protein|nr:hypothetical protein [Candidatus Acidoferrum sp.]
MNARIEDGMLVIELPLEKPRPSSSGKTLLVASTRGVQNSTARLKGRFISVVANAFIAPDDTSAGKQEQSPVSRKKNREEAEDEEEED